MKAGYRTGLLLQQRRGSALFLCIAGTAALTVCGILAQGARIRLAEATLYRALASEVSATLGSSNPMRERFGVLCVNGDDCLSPVYARLASPVDGHVSAQKMFDDPLSAPRILAEAVGEYMRYRLPAVLVTQAVARIRSIAEELRQENGSGMPSALQGETDSTPDIGNMLADWLGTFDFTVYLGDDEPDPPPMAEEDGEDSNSWLEDLRAQIRAFLVDRILGEELLSELRNIRDCLRRAADTGTGMDLPNVLDLSSISTFLTGMDDWLDVDADPLYRKCAHVEYVMGVLSRSLPEREPSSCSYAKGLEGRDFTLLAVTEGPDVERVITGAEDARQAGNRVYITLLGLRFGVRAVVNFTDSARFQRARTAAAAISGVVALISGGSGVLPEAPLAAAIVAVWSLLEAFGEADHLKEGEGVPLCPGLDAVVLDYGDYLRLMLYLIPEEVLFERLYSVMSTHAPGNWCRRVTATGGMYYRTIRVTGYCVT